MRNLLTLVLIAFAPLSAFAGDLSKIDRTIAKEPVYESNPKYCLLVFGPEAKTFVWLVLDGDLLYVDRNGNGDLTEPGERVLEWEEIGSILRDGKPAYHGGSWKRVVLDARQRSFQLHLEFEIERKFRQFCLAPVANSPADARIFCFDGPLSLRVYPPHKLTKGEHPDSLVVYIQTLGLDERVATTAVLDVIDGLPKNIHPVAEIEFPALQRGAKPIKAEYVLKQRC